MAFFLDSGGLIDSTDSFQGNSARDLSGLSLSQGPNAVLAALAAGNVKSGNSTSLADSATKFTVYRLHTGKRHSATYSAAAGNAVEEDFFSLSPVPRSGAPAEPILGCSSPSDSAKDDAYVFASTTPACGGMRVAEIFGYSYEASYAGASPIYSCHDGSDRFISWDSQCEGKSLVAPLGYALHATVKPRP
jgi:hypothetical protein